MRARSVILGAVAVTVLPLTTSCALYRHDCESMPAPMFHYRGVTYLPRTVDDSLTADQLGDVLATQQDDMPKGLSRCENVQLKDGQGSLPPGSNVYAIDGTDPSVAIAVDFGSGYLELRAPAASITTIAGD